MVKLVHDVVHFSVIFKTWFAWKPQAVGLCKVNFHHIGKNVPQFFQHTRKKMKQKQFRQDLGKISQLFFFFFLGGLGGGGFLVFSPKKKKKKKPISDCFYVG